MTGSFILDYCLLVFLGSCGVFQIAAANDGFQGLVFFRQRLGSFLLGAVLLVGAFAWFFLSESRNVPDTANGMNGNEQFAYFFAGAGASLAFTLLASSLRNWALGAGPAGGGPPPLGLEAMRQSNYMRALSRSLRKFWLRPRRLGEMGHRTDEPIPKFRSEAPPALRQAQGERVGTARGEPVEPQRCILGQLRDSPPQDVDGGIPHKEVPGHTDFHRRAGSETSRLGRGCSTKSARDLSGEEQEDGLPP